MTAHGKRNALRRVGRVGSIVALCLALSSCGFGGDDDDPDPTATSEPQLESVPTEDPMESSATPDEEFVLIPPSPDASGNGPVEADEESTPPGGTPVQSGPSATVNAEATPDEDDVSADATAEPATSGTPESGTTLPVNSVSGSDGTSGAGGAADLVAAAEGTPAATPEVADVAEVDSCDEVDAPPFSGDSSAFVASEEVNFRTGPGSDCDSVLEAPLAAGQEITVLSDPVVRSDDPDRILWVQVDVDGDVGWIATEFIEPSE